MKRGVALALVDHLTDAGYSVTMMVRARRDDFFDPSADEDGRQYFVSLAEISADKVDVRALVQIADDLGVDCGYGPLKGSFGFTDLPPERPDAVHGRRRHPR